MYRFISRIAQSFWVIPVSLIAFSLQLGTASAATTLSTDIEALVTQAQSLNVQMTGLALTAENTCAELDSAISSVGELRSATDVLSASLVAPISVDLASLEALDNLLVTAASIAGTLPALSNDITLISTASEQADIQAALDAMLKLSDDIGEMADRILEMADKILLMSDNIGAMADRILLTQQIQSTNMALTQASILTTQQNIILLSASIDTSVYNTALGSLINTGNVLSLDMSNTPLTEINMADELAGFESRVSIYLASVLNMLATINADSAIASHYINSDTLTMLGDLSVINAALASSLNSFTQTVTTLAPDTNIDVLNAAIYSTLRLASDIGLMGDRIVEMGDDINTMADNIGLMSLRIIETQTLQQSNLNLTLANLSTAKTSSVSAIAAFGL